MADCECLEGCPFFNDRMESMPSLSNIYKKKYCKTDSSRCARYMVFKALGKPAVPVDLFPNQIDIAQALIQEKVKL